MKINTNYILLIGVALVAASVSPLSFTLSATGLVSFGWLGTHAIVPAVIIWFSIFIISIITGNKNIRNTMLISMLAGIIGTVAMEVIRIVGFQYYNAMPGDMPTLMGVKLTNQFMIGPDLWSNVVGNSDHFWNGISFSFIFIALFGKVNWKYSAIYSLFIGTTFMLSPVMDMLGAGYFGQDFAPIAFPVTVYLAHLAWGITFGLVNEYSKLNYKSLFSYLLTIIKNKQHYN
ncbi:hypothetical protein L0B53_03815 [Vibrio sp. SS-MA-C1-2]|uniref:hypothetical protein n=1 Tax=Vibrio sp. SS-MA-C1-2 TaxID=2908646 RepID=UPI001F1C740F|nr:hypothetical protein [Vibrio sp. SS-MA-C1-2]UJF17070.1 hypothetical protein L0B53_03815 [Vibrio sp. SS-MA-C1-2]